MKNNIKPILNEYVDRDNILHVYGVMIYIATKYNKIINIFNKAIEIKKYKIEYCPIHYKTLPKGCDKKFQIERSELYIKNDFKRIKNNSIISFNLFNNIISISIINKMNYNKNKVRKIIDNIILE